MKLLIRILPVIFAVLSCTGDSGKTDQTGGRSNKPPVIINIHGANALYPLAQIWADHYMSGHPGVRIIVFPASSTKGKTDVMNGLADIGMYSNPSPDGIGDSLLLLKVAKDAVMPTVNDQNPDLQILVRQGISPGLFKDIFVNGTITYWNQVTGAQTGKKITVYSRSDLSGAGTVWAEFLGTKQENLIGTGVYGDAGMTQAIKSNVNSIGYDNLRYIFDHISGKPYPGIATLPIDFNNNRIVDPEEAGFASLESMKNAIHSGAFPSPLARELYFIINSGNCSTQALDFLTWVLTEGLSDIDKSGYVSLSAEEYESEKMKLKVP